MKPPRKVVKNRRKKMDKLGLVIIELILISIGMYILTSIVFY